MPMKKHTVYSFAIYEIISPVLSYIWHWQMLASTQLYNKEKKIHLHVLVKYVPSNFSDFSHSQPVDCCIGKMRRCWKAYVYFSAL